MSCSIQFNFPMWTEDMESRSYKNKFHFKDGQIKIKIFSAKEISFSIFGHSYKIDWRVVIPSLLIYVHILRWTYLNHHSPSKSVRTFITIYYVCVLELRKLIFDQKLRFCHRTLNVIKVRFSVEIQIVNYRWMESCNMKNLANKVD